MRFLICICFIFCLSSSALAQIDTNTEKSKNLENEKLEVFELPPAEEVDIDSVVYVLVEEMPIFTASCLTKKDTEQCSRESWFKYLRSIKTPKNILKKREKARVYCSFIVEKNGEISTTIILRSSGNLKLDKAAIEHLKKMPTFYKPGFQRGEAVRVKYNFPIDFKG